MTVRKRFAPLRNGIRWAVVLAVASVVCPTVQAALPVAYFTAGTAEPEDRAGWTALAEEYPRWVRPVRPDRTREVDAPAATEAEINDAISYIRVRRLGNDLESIRAALHRPGLIIDLRYVHGDRDETVQLGQLLARRPVALTAVNASHDETIAIDSNPERSADQTTIVVVNGGTSGPVEALLDALQSQGDGRAEGVMFYPLPFWGQVRSGEIGDT
jgi:hypothetical protein